MKKLFLLFLLSFSICSFAQSSKASYPGGENAFRNDFMKMVHAYVDSQIYAVNGNFTFIIEIDKSGNMAGLKIFPRVKNNQEFTADMEFAMKKIKKKWKPAMSKGVSVGSNYIFNINFTTDYADHGD